MRDLLARVADQERSSVKRKELTTLIKTAYDHVGKLGRDAARIYVAVVELDGQVRTWKKRAEDLGWTENVMDSALME